MRPKGRDFRLMDAAPRITHCVGHFQPEIDMTRRRTGRPMVTTLAACIALLGGALALPAAAQAPGNSGAGATRGFQMVYALGIDGKTGLLNGVTGLPSVAPTNSGAAPTGVAKTPVGPGTLTLHASHGLPTSFYGWVSGTNEGAKSSRTTISILGTDTTGRVSQAATLSDASVLEVGFPALDAASNAVFAMDVKTQGILRVEPTAKPMPAKQMNDLLGRMGNVRWVVSGYRLMVGKLDMARVSRIEAFTLRPGGALALQLTTSGVTSQALESLAPPPPIKGQKPLPVPAPGTLDGQLLLTAASGQVLAAIVLHGATVTSLTQAALNGPTGGGITVRHAVLSAKQAQLNFAPPIAQ